MRPICVAYHCLLRAPTLDTDWLFQLLADQMACLRDSGLADVAEKIFIGVNGTELDRMGVSLLAPKKAVLFASPEGKTELPTLIFLQNWVFSNPGWNVCYFHMKGAKYPGNEAWTRWRRCMERAVIWGWPECVEPLERGYDLAGAHWLTHARYSMVGEDQRYFGGNFFWATSDYLRTLPQIAEDSDAARFEAEVWVGKSPTTPRVMDFAPHWPIQGCR
ncbi:MAG: hypothetical protein WA830_25695 [Candidatus Sulfotelmatobacter sp.]